MKHSRRAQPIRLICLMTLAAVCLLAGCAAPGASGQAVAAASQPPPSAPGNLARPVTTPTIEPTRAVPDTVVPASTPTALSTPTRSASPAPSPPPVVSPTARLEPNGPPHDPGPLTWAHPGPYIAPGDTNFQLASFSSRQPLLTTYYFYWHDLTNPARRARMNDFWAQQPPDPGEYTFASPATHRQQFTDMQAAGIDFALPVYWGEPGHPGRAFNPTAPHFWSTEGIPPMVEALDQMAAAGHPFKIGMFYDTTILANADLTTPDGKAYFYVNVRDFYSRIPPKYWAAIDGHPIVWLYDTQWVSKYDQSSLDYLSDHFARDFGGLRPYIVREWQWYQSKGVQPQVVMKSDNLYAWGAAPSGFNQDPRLGVSEVGPGFSNTLYCKTGLAGNCFDVDRRNGAYYTGELEAALRAGRTIAAVETWNEFSEGSDVADTVQFGRTYIELTRRFADAFHAGRRSF
ncbi:MAG: DUF5010 domain-containing protein [Chloroflexota bacterium]